MTIAIAVLAVTLRVLMLLSAKSLWGDEWFSIELAQKSFRDVFLGSVHDVHPPAYFLALHGMIRLFGNTEWMYRLISFLAGIALVGTIYFLAKVIFGKRAALYAFFLTALSPYLLQSSNEIRSYALLALLASLTLLFYTQALREPQRLAWRLGYAVSAVTAIYVEHYAWFVVLATGVTLFFERIHQRERKDLWRAFFCVSIAGSASLALAAYQAVFHEHMFETYRIREFWSAAILLKKIIGVPWHFTNGYYFSMITVDRVFYYLRHSPVFWMSIISTSTAAMLLVFSFKRLFSKDRALFVLAGMVLIFPTVFLILFYSIRLQARYLIFSAPIFFVMIGGALATLQRKNLRNAALLILSTAAVIGSAHTLLLKTDAVHKEDYKELISYVFLRAKREDVVCGLSPQVRYYRKQLGFEGRAIVVPELGDLSPVITRSAKRVWVLDQLNMHEEVWRRNYEQIKIRLASLGFFPAQAPYRFGGDEGLVVLYLFERR